MVVLRYWSDTLTSPPADMSVQAISPAVELWDAMDAVEFCTWSNTGVTQTYFQVKDDHDQWSSVIQRTFNIDVLGQAPNDPVISGPPGGIDPNTEYTFTADASGGADFDWQFPSGWTTVSQSGGIITVTSPADPQSGTVLVSASNACGTSGQGSWLLSPTGIAAEGASSLITLYPNPTSGLFTISTGGSGPMRIAVYNSTGQQVRQLQRAAADRCELDLGNEASGLYIVRVMQGAVTTRLQVMVEH